MDQRRTYRRRFFMFPFFAGIAALMLGGVVMFLWNAILPSLLHIGYIKYWEAVGLLALCRILLGNFGGRMQPGGWDKSLPNNGGLPNDGPRFGGMPWRSKWRNMTDEERKQFRDEWRRRCGKPPKSE